MLFHLPKCDPQANAGRRRRRPGVEPLEGRALLAAMLVNPPSNADQTHAEVGINPSTGDSVVVWQSQSTPGSDYDIYAQLYDNHGVATGSAFRVNTTTANDQTMPSVSMNASGNFIVTWQSLYQLNSSSGFEVVGRFFTAGAASSSPEFIVNTTTAASQYESDVALNNNNEFAVTWMSEGQGPTKLGSWGGGGGGGGAGAQARPAVMASTATAGPATGPTTNTAPVANLQGVMAQEFTVNGTTVSKYGNTEVTVNTFQSSPEGEIQAPSIGIDAAGDFAVAFSLEDEGVGPNNQEYDLEYAYARRYSNGANAIDTQQVMVNPSYNTEATEASIAVNPSGQIVVVWSGIISVPTQGPIQSYGIYSQLWNMSSATPGSITTVSPAGTGNDKLDPQVSMNAGGNYEVTWQSANVSGGNQQIYAAQMTSSGATAVPEALVTSPGDGLDHVLPMVALDDSGDYQIVWVQQDSSGANTHDVWTRYYTP